jgi:hypothetical protein
MTEKSSTVGKWTEEATEQLLSQVSQESPISAATVEATADAMGRTVRSVASKLRKLGLEVASLAKSATPKFSAEQTAQLKEFVSANSGAYTYKTLAEAFLNGTFSAKEIQGKVLALDLTSHIKPSEKIEVASKYTEAEEAQFIALANGGAFIEDIAQALGKEVASVRGKALSLSTKKLIAKIPAQRTSTAKEALDPVAELGDRLATLTVSEIAAAVDKTPRGIKTLLTRRGLDCADYKGSVKKEKADAKATA